MVFKYLILLKSDNSRVSGNGNRVCVRFRTFPHFSRLSHFLWVYKELGAHILHTSFYTPQDSDVYAKIEFSSRICEEATFIISIAFSIEIQRKYKKNEWKNLKKIAGKNDRWWWVTSSKVLINSKKHPRKNKLKQTINRK